MKTVAVILLGGSGSRLNSDIPKQFLKINGKMICQYAIDVFEKSESIDEICLVYKSGFKDICQNIMQENQKVKYYVEGGLQRQYSVYNALKAITADYVVIHDGARPFITQEEVYSVIHESYVYKSAITALPVTDTIKIGSDNLVNKTLNRDNLWSVKTPQAFEYELLLDAHEKALKDDFIGTDDSSLIERLNQDVCIVKSNDFNIKITTKIDLITMKAILNGEL